MLSVGSGNDKQWIRILQFCFALGLNKCGIGFVFRQESDMILYDYEITKEKS